MKDIIIKSGREKSIERFHPWVFSGSVFGVSNHPVDGELVCLKTQTGAILGFGHYNEGSITVKVLSTGQHAPDQAWLKKRIEEAIAVRTMMGLPSKETNAYRLIHGEGDGLPGLIADVYSDVLVLQPHSAGMELWLDDIAEICRTLGFQNIVHKPVSKEPARVMSGQVLERIQIAENGMQLLVDVLRGQKTGFFLDQRDNRALVRHYASGKKVLNVFSYTGGFSIAALLGGAEAAWSLDSAAGALAIAEENAMINQVNDRHRTIKLDAVPFLESLSEQYDLVVLDPPAFAKHKSARHNAIQAYRRINEAAIRNVRSGGVLFTFSCSQVIDATLFHDIVASAAISTGRVARVLHYLHQPADHPHSIFHPEGEYLKGMALRIDDRDA